MKEMMQKLNVVKYAFSEEQKEDLMKKGFAPVKSASVFSDDGPDQKKESQPEPDRKVQKKPSQKNQSKSGQKVKPKQDQQTSPKSESTPGAEEPVNPDPQPEPAGDSNG